jgi:hypothetical protein
MLDPLIDRRRESLSKEGLSKHELEKRAEALTVLVRARHELDRLGDSWTEPVKITINKDRKLGRTIPVVGDFNVSLGK